MLNEFFGSVKLPGLTFFEPTVDGLIILAQLLKNKAVMEVGAGTGLLASKLQKSVPRYVPVDLLPREGTFTEVYVLDATRLSYLNIDIVVMARPCHGDWVHDTIMKALSDGCTVFYLGLPRNEDQDLQSLVDAGKPFHMAGVIPLGKEGELLYVFKP
jgi:hypothetical protein